MPTEPKLVTQPDAADPSQPTPAPTTVHEQQEIVAADAGTHPQPDNADPHPADLTVPYEDRAQAADDRLGGYEGATDPVSGNAVKRVVVAGTDDAPGTTVNRTLGPDVRTLPSQPPAEVTEPRNGSEDGQGEKPPEAAAPVEPAEPGVGKTPGV